MIYQYQMKLPGENILENSQPICDGGTDALIKKLLDKKLTGYFRIESDTNMGIAFLRNGQIENGYFLRGNEILSSSVSALLDFRMLCEQDGRVWVVELPENMLTYAEMLHLGTNLVPVTDTHVANFNAIYKHFHGKVENGLIIANDVKGSSILVHIVAGKWKLLAKRDQFDDLLEKQGSVIAFLEFDAEDIEKKVLDAARNRKEKPDIREILKHDIVEFLTTNYGDKAINLMEKIKNQEINQNNYKKTLKDISQFVSFFIDDKNSGGKIKSLEQKLIEQIRGN